MLHFFTNTHDRFGQTTNTELHAPDLGQEHRKIYVVKFNIYTFFLSVVDQFDWYIIFNIQENI